MDQTMSELTPAQAEELRWGAVAVGPASTGPDMPNPHALGEGEHVNWGLRVRPSGDRWVMGIRDQSGQPRHEPCAICGFAVQSSHPGHAPVRPF